MFQAPLQGSLLNHNQNKTASPQRITGHSNNAMTSVQQPTRTHLQPKFDLPSFIAPLPTNTAQRTNIGTKKYKFS